jgi:hypothetical protein
MLTMQRQKAELEKHLLELRIEMLEQCASAQHTAGDDSEKNPSNDLVENPHGLEASEGGLDSLLPSSKALPVLSQKEQAKCMVNERAVGAKTCGPQCGSQPVTSNVEDGVVTGETS